MDQPSKYVNFTSALENYQGIIFKVARAYTYNPDETEDLIQEIIIQFWKSFDRYDPNYKMSTWLYRIALNVSISYRAKSKKIQNISLGSLDLPVEDDDPSKEINLKKLYDAMQKLREIDRAFMILYLEGHSQKEMAEIMGTSQTNVSTRMNRLKDRLTKIINKDHQNYE